MHIDIEEYETDTPRDEHKNDFISEAFKTMPLPIVDSLKNEIASELIQSICHTVNSEIDGEIYGYPESDEFWEAHIYLPKTWQKN